MTILKRLSRVSRLHITLPVALLLCYRVPKFNYIKLRRGKVETYLWRKTTQLSRPLLTNEEVCPSRHQSKYQMNLKWKTRRTFSVTKGWCRRQVPLKSRTDQTKMQRTTRKHSSRTSTTSCTVSKTSTTTTAWGPKVQNKTWSLKLLRSCTRDTVRVCIEEKISKHAGPKSVRMLKETGQSGCANEWPPSKLNFTTEWDKNSQTTHLLWIVWVTTKWSGTWPVFSGTLMKP